MSKSRSHKNDGPHEIVRRKREALGLSQAELARRISRDPSWVSRFESKKIRATVDNLRLFARALDEGIHAFL